MRSWSILAGNFLGIEVRIHLTFLALLAFVWMSESAMKGNPSSPVRGLVLVALILASVVLHELAHAWVAIREGMRPKVVILLPTGGIPLTEDPPIPAPSQKSEMWKRDLRIAIAGPLVNLGIALISGAIVLAYFPQAQLWTKPFVHSNHLLRSLVWANLCLGLINLLPAYPLDGGRVLRAWFSRTMDLAQATRRAISIAHAMATLMIVVGMLLFMQGGYPDSWWVMAAGSFLLIGAQFEERSAIFHSVMETVHLEDVMLTDFATLSPADTLEDALEKAVHTLQDDFPVVRGGDMVGVISKSQNSRSPTHGRQRLCAGRDEPYLRGRFAARNRWPPRSASSARNLSIIPVVENQQLVGSSRFRT